MWIELREEMMRRLDALTLEELRGCAKPCRDRRPNRRVRQAGDPSQDWEGMETAQ
jgi:hypothetical protein